MVSREKESKTPHLVILEVNWGLNLMINTFFVENFFSFERKIELVARETHDQVGGGVNFYMQKFLGFTSSTSVNFIK